MKLGRFNNLKESISKFFTVNNSIYTAAIFIVIIPLILFFYLQQETEESIRDSIFEQQKQVQIDSSDSTSLAVGHRIDFIKTARISNVW